VQSQLVDPSNVAKKCCLPQRANIVREVLIDFEDKFQSGCASVDTWHK